MALALAPNAITPGFALIVATVVITAVSISIAALKGARAERAERAAAAPLPEPTPEPKPTLDDLVRESEQVCSEIDDLLQETES
jgi:hypothetical protein